MDVNDMIANLKRELTCSICLDYFTKPVTVDCGHSFCKECLFQSWEGTHAPWACPMCRGTIQSRDLETSKCLEDLVIITKQFRPHLSNYINCQTICDQHLAIQKLFCEDDQKLLCVSCLLSQEHKAHSVYLIEEYAENCKAKLCEALSSLLGKAKEAQFLLDQERRRVVQCNMEAQILKQIIIPEYIKTHPFLTKNHQVEVQKLDKEKRKNVKKLMETEARFSQYIQNLQKMTDELEKNFERPVTEMLLDIRSILERSEVLLFQCPEPAALPWTDCGMREILLTFQRDITLDPKTAKSNVILSEDLKSVKLASAHAEQAISVLGAQSFTSESHYWEVEVEGKSEWEVGIYKESLSKKGKFPGDVLSLMCLRMEEDFILWIPHTMESIHSRVPVHKLGIFLQYDCGHISFYNVTDNHLIYSFPPFIFQGPLWPFFSPGFPNEENNPSSLTICPLSTHC
ncbi:probable E3 ubiquitin-protein ligase TRIML1 [Dromiciops gliroides]|uniref:probable E3 ubiquitin-protein ligase TRIML1 n=1 Tax=Dromiciops gliroides TaxID=33562 RepID=UPI001CC6248F|nr:probable E3 ubiquitin-protein ligase TRIML1 [Dromiciops gliroides]